MHIYAVPPVERANGEDENGLPVTVFRFGLEVSEQVAQAVAAGDTVARDAVVAFLVAQWGNL